MLRNRLKKEYLEKRTTELNKLNEKELAALSRQGKQKVAEEEQKEVKKIKQKHFVS